MLTLLWVSFPPLFTELCLFATANLLRGSFHNFGSADTFDQLIPVLVVLLLVLAHS